MSLIFRMCFLSVHLSVLPFSDSLASLWHLLRAACGECNTEIKNGSVNLPAMLTTRKTSMGHISQFIIVGL